MANKKFIEGALEDIYDCFVKVGKEGAFHSFDFQKAFEEVGVRETVEAFDKLEEVKYGSRNLVDDLDTFAEERGSLPLVFALLGYNSRKSTDHIELLIMNGSRQIDERRMTGVREMRFTATLREEDIIFKRKSVNMKYV